MKWFDRLKIQCWRISEVDDYFDIITKFPLLNTLLSWHVIGFESPYWLNLITKLLWTCNSFASSQEFDWSSMSTFFTSTFFIIFHCVVGHLPLVLFAFSCLLIFLFFLSRFIGFIFLKLHNDWLFRHLSTLGSRVFSLLATIMVNHLLYLSARR